MMNRCGTAHLILGNLLMDCRECFFIRPQNIKEKYSPKYTTAYIVQQSMYMFFKLGLNKEKSLNTLLL